MDRSHRLRIGIYCLHHFRYLRHLFERHVVNRLHLRFGFRHGLHQRLGNRFDLPVFRQQHDLAKL